MSRGNTPIAKSSGIWDISPMDITREYQLKMIGEAIQRLRTNKNALEKTARIPQGSIKELDRGKRPMDAGKWQKIMSVISENRVYVVGGIGSGDEVDLVGDFDKIANKKPGGSTLINYKTFVVPKELAHRVFHAFEVKSEWEGPMLRAGDMVWTTEVKYRNFDEYLDSEVLVTLVNGKTYIKTLTKGSMDGKYSLIGISTHGFMRDIEIAWCAQVVGFIKKIEL